MVIIRYTEWDGTQQVRLTADQVFEKLAEYLSYTDDVRQALDWLMRNGIDSADLQVKGVDEFLEDLREAMRKLYDNYNFDRVFDEHRRRLEELLDLERDTLEGRDGEAANEKRRQLDDLPHPIAEAVEKLRDYDFEDDQARAEYERLLEDLDDVREMEEFQRRYGELFQGADSLDFERGREVMRSLQQLKRLEEDLVSGNFESIDAEELSRILGGEAGRNFQRLRQMMGVLRDAGYLRDKDGRVALSPKAVRKLGQLALRDIYQSLLRDREGGHGTDHRGITEVRPEMSRPYSYGDPMNVEIVPTLKKSLARRSGTPLDVRPEDFEVTDTNRTTTSSTVLLLDMSWSMSWEGRFAAAKKVALAMESLIRSRYPRDYFGIVGFYTRAQELKMRDLPEATWNMGDPFTNLQDGLRLAGELLRRHPSANQHMIVITDGQPTAYFSRGRLYCEWPLSFGGISMRAAQETLKEVERVTRRGVVINTFMLDDSPSLRAFVEKMTRINKGRALFTRPDRLGRYLLVDYIGRKRKHV